MVKVYHREAMPTSPSISRAIVLSILIGAVAIVGFLQVEDVSHTEHLSVHFLDVGQGDAIFIETPDGTQVLVDGGPDSSVLSALAGKISFFDTHIDMVIATHPDTDHIGGLRDVLASYEVATILKTEHEGDTASARAFATAVSQEGAEVIYARRGQEFTLGASTTLEVLFPETDPSAMETNTSSIIVRIVYGDTAFLLTGDAPKSIEEYLVLVEGEHLQSDVLKVGHHGSRTSTSELFLNEVQPSIAVISASADNRYGHPHVEVTDALFNARVETFSTAEEGTITLTSDGASVWKQH